MVVRSIDTDVRTLVRGVISVSFGRLQLSLRGSLVADLLLQLLHIPSQRP